MFGKFSTHTDLAQLCLFPDQWLCHSLLDLTHWGRDKMVSIFQTTFSNVFSWNVFSTKISLDGPINNIPALVHLIAWHWSSHCWLDYWCKYASLGLNDLTHWGRDKMAAVSQTTFSNAFSWMKIFEFRLKFHWSLFLRVQSTIFQHWFR